MCGKHVIAPDPEALLASVGATAVLCLTREHELNDRYPDYVSWLRANADGAAMWLPVPDFGVPTDDEAHSTLDRLVTRLGDGDGVVIHCAAGIGRSGTFAAALLVMLGASAEGACAHVRRHRPMAGPEVGEQRALVERAVSWRRPQ